MSNFSNQFRLTVTLLGLILIVGFANCRHHETSHLLDRLARSTEMAEYAWNVRKDGVFGIKNKLLYDKLRDTSAEALMSPNIVFALKTESESAICLGVWWIENRPSLDGVFIFATHNMTELRLAMPDAYHRENENASNHGVVYYVGYKWDLDVAPDILNKEGAQVRLIQSGSVLSESVRVTARSGVIH